MFGLDIASTVIAFFIVLFIVNFIIGKFDVMDSRATRKMQNELDELNEYFVYRSDKEQYGKREYWAIMKPDVGTGKLYGDCEDYSLYLAYQLAGKSWLKLSVMMILGLTQIWYVKDHAVLLYKGNWVDNQVPVWNDKPQHKILFPMILPFVVIKFLVRSFT